MPYFGQYFGPVTGGEAPTAEEIADAVWDELRAGHVGAGSFGEGVLIFGIKNTLDSLNDAPAVSAADVKTALEANGSKLDHLWEMTEDDGGVRRLTANALEEGPSVSAQEVRDAMKLAPTAGDPAAGSVDKHLDDILEDTSTTLDDKIDTIDGIVDDILVDTGTTLDGKIDTIDTAIGALPTATENADEVLTRDWTSVTGEAARSVLNALRFLRNKWSVAGTTLTVTEEDDSTPAWTAALTTNAAADPVTGSDPS